MTAAVCYHAHNRILRRNFRAREQTISDVTASISTYICSTVCVCTAYILVGQSVSILYSYASRLYVAVAIAIAIECHRFQHICVPFLPNGGDEWLGDLL